MAMFTSVLYHRWIWKVGASSSDKWFHSTCGYHATYTGDFWGRVSHSLVTFMAIVIEFEDIFKTSAALTLIHPSHGLFPEVPLLLRVYCVGK